MSDVPEGLRQALEDRYTIERRLGEGGMATVYLAEDIKHERKVALKVLKPELAAVIGGERFVTEIKTTAGLQHPHILPLFDSGVADGFLYYVMPFIEGETLRDRLDRERQLPVEDALSLTKACAGALDYAHRHGVIHRDIKPENILLHEGNPVVADFGIALAISAAGGGRLTETGLSLGTPHYMSPEQATADRDLTSRSDVYSLGCVLYEMLAGDPPHTGPSAQAILMRILTEDPRPITDQRRSVPPNVAAAVAKSLEKLPADRFESASAFAEALDDRGFAYTAPQRAAATAGSTDATAPATTAGGGAGSWWTDVRSVAALAIAVVSLGALGFSMRSAGGDEAPSRAVIRAPLGIDPYEGVSISPDGSMVAYTIQGEGLYLKRLAETDATLLLPGSIGYPSFSPDGAWVLFVNDENTLQRMAVTGGAPTTIYESPESPALFPYWGDGGSIVFLSLDGMYVVPWTGQGAPERISEDGLLLRRSPRFLPGSEALLYTRASLGAVDPEVWLLDLASGEERQIIAGGADARYVATGHLLFVRPDQVLLAAPFDLGQLEVTGPPVPVLDSVGVNRFGWIGSFDVSAAGHAVYSLRTPGGGSGPRDLEYLLLDADGVESGVGLPPGDAYAGGQISPDGRYLAYIDGNDTMVYDLIVGSNRVVATTVDLTFSVDWHPDGRSLAFGTFGGATGSVGSGVYLVDVESGEAPVRIWENDGIGIPTSWSPDGSSLMIMDIPGGIGADNSNLSILSTGDDPQLTRYLDADWAEEGGVISPDGAWAAYISNEGGARAIYVRSFPTPGPKTRVSPGGGSTPHWSPDGSVLYYRQRDTIYAARVQADDAFGVERVDPLLVLPMQRFTDVAPDGRLLILRVVEEEAEEETGAPDGADEEAADDAPSAFIVVNWFEEMKARLGEGGN